MNGDIYHDVACLDMFDLLIYAASLDTGLCPEDRPLVSEAFQNVTLFRRKTWRRLNAAEHKAQSQGNEDVARTISEWRLQVEDEIKSIGNRIISAIDRFILPNASTGEDGVFYYKL